MITVSPDEVRISNKDIHISEAELEDYICNNPSRFWPSMQIIERQVPLPSGILDILGFDNATGHVLVIELKATPLQEKDVGQLLRYSYDVSCALSCSYSNLFDDYVDKISGRAMFHFTQLHKASWYKEGDYEFPPDPVLVGSAIDYKVYAALKGANAVPVIWWYYKKKQCIAFTHECCYEDGWFSKKEWKFKDRPDWLHKASELILTASLRLADEEVEELAQNLFCVNKESA